MIQERKGSLLNEHDLFSSLLAANEDLSKDEVKLSDSELIGKPRFNSLRDCGRTVAMFFNRQYIPIDGRRARGNFSFNHKIASR